MTSLCRGVLLVTMSWAVCACASGPVERDEYDYTWVRREPPAAFSKSDPGEPTEFTARLKIDVARKTVNVLEIVHFRGTELSRDIRMWTECSMFDEEN